MELLFKREQTPGQWARVNFTLWSKLEIAEDEQALISLYRFDETVLYEADDGHLLRGAIIRGIVVYLVVAPLIAYLANPVAGLVGGLMAAIFTGYWFLNEKRQTIFVKDLLHGRHFICKSVVELAKKEAWLEGACGVFRQVMESAKHWDGVERHTIEPLPKAEAKELILQAA